MNIKYFYEEGMCHALGYKGQYPVIYEPISENMYKRRCMGCSMIEDGRCTIHTGCEILQNAPEQMPYSWQLRDKKMT